MPKRSRDKQLAKLAQRRQAERRAAKRRRDLTIGLVAGGIALILVAVGAFILFGGRRSDRRREPFGVGRARNPDRTR